MFEGDEVIYSCGDDHYPRGRVFSQTCVAQHDE
jgi:hypothetical protein